MLKYTICFIKSGQDILMLNRHNAPMMGVWNGVGGKIEKGEDPETSVKREIKEETGLTLNNVQAKGVVTWDKGQGSGMYAFVAEVPFDFDYSTPYSTNEGILEWKSIDWITNELNRGVAAHVKQFLPIMINDPKKYNHECLFEEDGRLSKWTPLPLEDTILI